MITELLVLGFKRLDAKFDSVTRNLPVNTIPSELKNISFNHLTELS